MEDIINILNIIFNTVDFFHKRKYTTKRHFFFKEKLSKSVFFQFIDLSLRKSIDEGLIYTTVIIRVTVAMTADALFCCSHTTGKIK